MYVCMCECACACVCYMFAHMCTSSNVTETLCWAWLFCKLTNTDRLASAVHLSLYMSSLNLCLSPTPPYLLRLCHLQFIQVYNLSPQAHTHTHTHTNTHTHTQTLTHTYTQTHADIHAHKNTQTHTDTHTHTETHTRTRIRGITLTASRTPSVFKACAGCACWLRRASDVVGALQGGSDARD